MVIGSGLIAKAFAKYDKDESTVIFASGVSSSKEISEEAFLREEKLLTSHLEKYGDVKYFVYFSTCSVFDTYFEQSEYVKHKLNMEQIVIQKANRYNIFRLPQVLGMNNKNQLIGFFYDAIKHEKHFDLYDIERNIIDIDDVLMIASEIIDSKKFINVISNIANPKNMRVTHIVKILEKVCNKKANYTLINKEGSFKIDMTQMQSLTYKDTIFQDDYLENRIKKYYE